jgi:hypothetical protein
LYLDAPELNSTKLAEALLELSFRRGGVQCRSWAEVVNPSLDQRALLIE